MTKLLWDQVGERLFETGIDRGVLYLPNAQGAYDNGVAWNGLTQVEEDLSDDGTDPYYFDGVKYLDTYNGGDYQATLIAYTYPDEFWEFEGVEALGDGLYVDDQSTKVFGLAYRTLIGDDIESLDLGYKIHLVYNLTASIGSLDYQNGSNLVSPLQFQWRLRGVPEHSPTVRATAHIILDSRYLRGEILEALEDILYGDEDTAPQLPSLDSLIDIVLGWDARVIIPQPTTGLSRLESGVGDLTETVIDGIFYALPTTRLDVTSIPGLYVLTT